jgi:hypothetical protein
MGIKMNKTIYRIPVVIFILDIISVVLSYFWIGSNYIIWPMSVLTYVSFGVFVFHLKNIKLYDDIFVNGSGYMIIIIFICIIYTFVNFLVSAMFLYHGTPEMINGLYYLNNHGTIKEITQSEYYKVLLAENRLMSGTILLFAVLPVATCLRRLKLMKNPSV